MPETPTFESALKLDAANACSLSRQQSSVSLRALWNAVVRRWRLALAIEGGLVVLCLLYCLIAPNQYEARARVELRTDLASVLGLTAEAPASTSALSAPMATETIAGILRGDQLGWKVIKRLKLYDAPGFRGDFARRFSGFRPDAPSPEAQTWLLERFARWLDVQTLPRTLLVEIRFRSRDAALSAEVVNALIEAYGEQESQSKVQATAAASAQLKGQLDELKGRMDEDGQRLAEFEAAHGIVSTPETLANGQPGEAPHDSPALEMDELGKQLAAATSERILSEAEYHAALQGDPETVMASDPRLQSQRSSLATAVLEQIHTRRSQLEQERAQLSAEHGPSFPRVVEIGKQLDDLDRQKQVQDKLLVEWFRANRRTAVDREQMVRKSLAQVTQEGMQRNRATTEYSAMRQQADSSRDVYLKVLAKVEEAGLTAGVPGSNIMVVDAARVPSKPVTPDLPLDMAITIFAGLWLAVGGVLLSESMKGARGRGAALLLAAAVAGVLIHAQAPTPSTSGLPTGVARFPQSEETRSAPSPQEAPQVWGQTGAGKQAGVPPQTASFTAAPMPVPIAQGDLLEVSESHTPEFRSTARVSAAGTVTLPMIGEVRVAGMDEVAAAHAIEAALVEKVMLLHPLVSVLVTGYAGQDVSVLGEVARPGVYPYTFHHRLLDLIAAASGLTATAGLVANVFHANDAKTPHVVALDPGGKDAEGDHNPELEPGDTVEVSRAGLVYVVGDVIRPGGFLVDPVQGLTVVQALSLAWGPTMNAAAAKAVLIREQEGGRTLTTLNLKRMLKGLDPDQKVQDRDILYVPDSTVKNLVNRTMESAVQSTIGVTIYSALVYSQRY